jgi:glucose-6-phosphate dehydrogenase assembly protein OpcA
MIELTDTNASEIAAAFVKDRIRAGSPAMGMVLTLIVVVDDDLEGEAMAAARAASKEHPARVLGVILGDARGAPQVHAQVGIGQGWTGETAVIRLRGEVVKHPDSVVLPLLLPDSPVAIWWASNAPMDPAADPLGALAQRRITDAAAVTRGKQRAMRTLCTAYAPGNTDLAWTRLTPWRALLASALDQYELPVTSASVTAERISPSADLIVTWLADRLKVRVERKISAGPGITEIVMNTKDGPIRVSRLDGKLATISSPERPDRPIALKRLEIPALLAEELRRLDEDDVYAAVAKSFAKRRLT